MKKKWDEGNNLNVLQYNVKKSIILQNVLDYNVQFLCHRGVAHVDFTGLFLLMIHCPYLIKGKYWSHTRLYRSNPSGHSHYRAAGVLALCFLRLSCNQMVTGSIFETANLQSHCVLWELTSPYLHCCGS